MSAKFAQPLTAPQFDDHIGLGSIAFEMRGAVIFHGASGSGKSTCIEHLLETHPDFRGQPRMHITGGPIEWRLAIMPTVGLLVIDELLAPVDVLHMARLMRAGHMVIAASHLPPWLTGLLGITWPLRQFATDRDERKIERFLQRLGFTYSQQMVVEFCKTYGATYTDVEIILDHADGSDFDCAYNRFTQFCSIERVRPHRAWFSGPYSR